MPLLDQVVALMAPGRTGHESFIRWLGRYVRLSGGPGATAATFAAVRDVDIRPVLGEIRAPTLVLHRVGDRAVPISNAHHLAAHIPGARLVTLPGDDHIIWAGDVNAIAAHVVRFVAGVTGEPLPDPA